MIEISSAVSSSMSSTSAGIVACRRSRRAPASLAGDQLVAVVGQRPDEDGLQDAVLADGRGELVERLLVECQPRLLRVGLDAIDRDDCGRRWRGAWSSGDSRLTMAGDSSRSSDSRRAAVARKSGLAKVDHLPGELAVGPRGVGGPGVRRDRSADERRLAELHGIADDGVEDVMVADDTQLVEHVAGEVRPGVEECRQQAEDPEVAVELERGSR